MSIKLISASAPVADYDLGHISFDLSRKTAVLIRQSMKNASKDHYESRLLQENLIPIAIKLRGDEDESNILVFDEGAGVSGTKGYDQREKLSALYLAIANDTVGSLLVARPDRLFRDKHFLNVSMFTELAERKKLILIVPGRRIYDFTRYPDLQAFQKDMQDAYSYLATHVRYMNDARYQKMLRGLWGGGAVCPPYVIDRSAWKEQQVQIIYKPWVEPAIDLFKRFKAYEFSMGHICRYIESLPYVFPLPLTEDMQRFLFKTNMRLVPGGYTFSTILTVRYYLSNLTLGGYAKVGKDEEGNTLLLPNAFEAAIPFDLLDEAYGAITGFHIDGAKFEGPTNTRRFMRSNPQGSQCLFSTSLITSEQGFISTRPQNERTCYQCFQGTKEDGRVWKYRTGLMNSKVLWTLPASELDRIVVERLFELAERDSDMAERVRKVFDSMKGQAVNEVDLLTGQIETTRQQIDKLDFVLTSPTIKLDVVTAGKYAEILAELRPKLARLLKRQKDQPDLDPGVTITNFYYILAHLPTEFGKQSRQVQRQIMGKLVKQLTVTNLSPHLFRLYIVWQDGIATRPDVALLWRGHALRDSEGWRDEENEIARQYWHDGEQLDIMRLLPLRSWTSIRQQANVLGVVRSQELRFGAHGHRKPNVHETMTYKDLEVAKESAENGEDEEYLCEVITTLAKGASRTRMTSYWPVPVDIVGFSSFITENEGCST